MAELSCLSKILFLPFFSLCTPKLSENGGFLSLPRNSFPGYFHKPEVLMMRESRRFPPFFPRLGGIPSEVALARSRGVVMIDRRFGCSEFDRTELPKFRVPWASKSILSSVRELPAKLLRLERAAVPGVEFDQICLATKKKSTTS